MSFRFAHMAVTAAILVSASGLAATQAHAIVPTSAATINTDAAGLALQGYDPVAYFAEGAPRKGNPAFKITQDGATYYFANAANLARFKADPVAYLPQYGGFCAMGTANGKKFEGDPNVWKIVDKKLYLNFNPDVGHRWNQDIPANIDRANDNWPAIKTKTPQELEDQ